jgi:hypothetical protein
MAPLRVTFRTDGPSDAMLIPIAQWVIAQHRPELEVVARAADLRTVHPPPKPLADQLLVAVRMYPCDLLLIHRDAEHKDLVDHRRSEIRTAVEAAGPRLSVPHVPVVPVRMSEAWLLIDELAIRRAADNRNGSMALTLPTLGRLEDLAEPKQVLNDLLRHASGLPPKRLKRFRPAERVLDVAEFINDFSPLRRLSAFQSFEADVRAFLDGWQPAEG